MCTKKNLRGRILFVISRTHYTFLLFIITNKFQSRICSVYIELSYSTMSMKNFEMDWNIFPWHRINIPIVFFKYVMMLVFELNDSSLSGFMNHTDGPVWHSKHQKWIDPLIIWVSVTLLSLLGHRVFCLSCESWTSAVCMCASRSSLIKQEKETWRNIDEQELTLKIFSASRIIHNKFKVPKKKIE